MCWVSVQWILSSVGIWTQTAQVGGSPFASPTSRDNLVAIVRCRRSKEICPPKQGDLSSEARLERATAFRLELVDRIRVRILGAETWAEVAAKRMKEANQQALQALVDWQRMNEANQQALQALVDMNQAMDLVNDCAYSCSAWIGDPDPPTQDSELELTQPLPSPDVNEGNDRNDADVNEVNDAADVNEGNGVAIDGDAKANEGNDASTLQPKKQKTSHDRGTP